MFKSYVHPISRRILPVFMINKHGGYTAVVNHATRLKKTKGIILNSFTEL